MSCCQNDCCRFVDCQNVECHPVGESPPPGPPASLAAIIAAVAPFCSSRQYMNLFVKTSRFCSKIHPSAPGWRHPSAPGRRQDTFLCFSCQYWRPLAPAHPAPVLWHISHPVLQQIPHPVLLSCTQCTNLKSSTCPALASPCPGTGVWSCDQRLNSVGVATSMAWTSVWCARCLADLVQLIQGWCLAGFMPHFIPAAALGK